MGKMINKELDVKHKYALLVKILRSFLSQKEIVGVIKKVNRKATVHQSTISSWERGCVNFNTQYLAVDTIGKILGCSSLNDFKKMLQSEDYDLLINNYTASYWGLRIKSYLLQQNEKKELLHQLTTFSTELFSQDSIGVVKPMGEAATSRFSRFLRHLRGSFSQLAFSDWVNSFHDLGIEISQEWVSAREKGKKSYHPLPVRVFQTFPVLASVTHEEFLAYLDGNDSDGIVRFFNRSPICNQLCLLGKSLSINERENIQSFLIELIKKEQEKVLSPLQELLQLYLRDTGKTWNDLLLLVEPYGLSKQDILEIQNGRPIPYEKTRFLWAAIAAPNGTTYFKREIWNRAVEETLNDFVA